LIKRHQPVQWTALVTLAGFFLLALSAQRAIVWWGLVAPVVMAGLLRGAPPERSLDGPPPRPEGAGPARVIVVALVLLAVLLAPWWRGDRYQTFLTAAPPGLTDAVRHLPAGSRLMVHQPWGSWFEFAVPQDFVFVDARIEIVPEDIWRDYGQVGFAGAGWNEVLNKWQVDVIVADKDWELLPYLRATTEWQELPLHDPDGAVFVRA